MDRLYAHIAGKEFWAELIAFTSKDDNLTKGHVKYLESRLIQLASEAGRYRVTNSASPLLPALPRPDRDAMEEYLLSAKTLLAVLGHRVLEPYVAPSRPKLPDLITPTQVESQLAQPVQSSELLSPANPVFKLHISDLIARAARTDEGLVVLSGSEAATTVQNSLSGGYRALRDKLVQTGVLAPNGTKLQFTRDQLLNSPSQAAAVVVGYSINGRDAWRMSDGTTYSAYEQRVSQSLLNELSQGQ